jgi:hypothetical protein
LFIGSHLDTVPRAGAFDGILGVVIVVALIESLAGRRLPFAIEVVGFSEIRSASTKRERATMLLDTSSFISNKVQCSKVSTYR